MELRRASWWQRCIYLLAAALAIQAILLVFWIRGPRLDFYNEHHPGPDTLLNDHETLKHNADSLTSEQCLAAYPDLYYELNRAVKLWHAKKHTINEADVDISWQATGPFDGGAMRVLIHENQLRVVQSINAMGDQAYQERGLGILQLIQRALEQATAAGEKLPTIEAAIVLQDVSYPPTEDGTHSFWTWARPLHDIHFNRTKVWEGKELHYERYWNEKTFQRVWLVPNFDFWFAKAIGYYDKTRELAKQHDNVKKIPKIVWRGTEWVNPDIRDVLVNITKGKHWADVKYSDTNTRANHLDLADLCNYAMTVHTEGFSYSGRLKHLLKCNSLPFVHELDYTTHYYHLLKKDGPKQNYVAVKKDFSDLEEKVLYYLAHPQEADRIIANHLAMFREKYLTAEATSCYLLRLIHMYASVAFTPKVTMKMIDGTTGLRGKDVQTFIKHPEDFTDG